MKKNIIFLLLVGISLFGHSQTYYFPDETEPHEGTWLQWPHQYEYGVAYRNSLDATWVAMTNALQYNENVHIIAYNTTEQTRIINLLNANNVPLTNVDFKIFQTNDVWVRDNGPIYVRNAANQLVIQDWGFNGWGGDYNFSKCNVIPNSIGTSTTTTVVNLNNVMTVEGGSWEMDGNGVLMATRSSILSQTNPSSQIHTIRNPQMTETQANTIFFQNLGATKTIWLDGFFSTDDITDAHIDGFVKFAPNNTLVTMNQSDLLYWGLSLSDINVINTASNVSNVVYTKTFLPLTQNNVSKTNGVSLGYKGSYVNYYVANNRVLVPNYNDPNDAIANQIIQNIYPGRTVVGIDVRNLYENGGMVHCVTQQQPASSALLTPNFTKKKVSIFPNPTSNSINIETNYNITSIEIYNSIGQKIDTILNNNNFDISKFSIGAYILKIYFEDGIIENHKIIKL